MKKFFRTIHLYLGLATGVVVMITCFTGATLVFEKELQHFIYPARYTVEPKDHRVPLTQLVSSLQQQVPGAKVTSVKVYSDPKRSVELSYTVPDKTKQEGARGNSSQAFMNPYSGALISLYNHRNSFFYTMFALHRWLLAEDTGKLIVGISTSAFLFILITGIVLWWPKKVKKVKQRLTLKLSAGWKRINHDLHITIGFYCAVFLFLFAFTGLAWSFQWFNDAIYTITGTENKRPDPPLSVYQAGIEPISADLAFNAVQKAAPNSEYYSVSLPKDSVSAIAVQVLSNHPVHEKASDQYFVDQYKGEVIGTALYKDRNLGQRVRSTFYPVHVGSIAGWPGRIIAFLACIAGVTFPITGVILWINRLKKEKHKQKKKTASSAVATKRDVHATA